MTESELQHAVRVASPIPIWRNTTGQATVRGRVIRFGLCVGSADLIGIRPLVISSEHVGTTVGQFVAWELKGPRGRVSREQQQFLDLVERNGGVAAVVRSVDDAVGSLR